jgi:hypothetical protein
MRSPCTRMEHINEIKIRTNLIIQSAKMFVYTFEVIIA